MQVKICGITNLEDALLCCELGADALGFIFYSMSKRFITYEKAKEIINQLPNFIVKVGVFVNHPFEEVNVNAKEIGLNIIQLHGEESPEYINEISLPVIKSFRVNETFDFSRLDKYPKCSFLLDTFSEHEPGGTGKTFNWETIPKSIRNKIILAGGISVENIESVFREVQPQAVDLSSSVESSPGIKDHKKLKEFFSLVNKMRYGC